MLLDVLKALADVSRLRLVAILLRGEFTVQELTAILEMGQSRVSRHLKILTEVGVLSVKRQGTWSYYRVSNESPFFFAIRSALEQELGTLPEREKDLRNTASALEARRQRSRLFFDQHARQWDSLARTLLPVPDYRDKLLALIPSGVQVVEIGLGTGGLLPGLTEKGCAVIGVDHSPAMLDEARRRLIESGIEGVDLRLGEMNHLPLPDHSVDCAILNMVLHHAADPSSVLGEIRRILVSGGALLLADLARHERELAREQLADQWLGFEEEELRDWLKEADFGTVAITQVAPLQGQEAVLLIQAYTTTKGE